MSRQDQQLRLALLDVVPACSLAALDQAWLERYPKRYRVRFRAVLADRQYGYHGRRTGLLYAICSTHHARISAIFVRRNPGVESISSFLGRGGMLFTSAESFISRSDCLFSVYVYQSAGVRLIIFAHNLVIFFAVLERFPS